MAKRIYTPQQEDAITARGGSVLVSAAAGSGKTSVLTERVIRLITDAENPIRADRLLIVTFTKAAAAEMKQRITLELQERLKADSHNVNLKQQLLLLHNADICTIDSFCSKIVRENFFVLGINRDLRIGSESELAIAKQDALDEALEELYSEGENDAEDDFIKLSNALSGAKSNFALCEAIFSIYESTLSHPFPLSWLKNAVRMYETTASFDKTEWGKTALKKLKSTVPYMKKLADYLVKQMSERLTQLETDVSQILSKGKKLTAKDNATVTYCEKFKADLESISECVVFSEYLEKETTWDNIVCKIKEFTIPAASCRYAREAADLKDDITNYRKELNRILAELKKLFSRTLEQCKSELLQSACLARGLYKAVKRFDERFKSVKNERGIADFSDLEHLALNLLLEEKDGKYERTPQSYEIAAKYDEIIIDEYQDTNMVQDMIFMSVSNNEDNLFTVGDVKQSIYRFREAMPEIFLNRREKYRIENRNNSDSKNYPPIFLSGNFRSRKGIIGSVNFIFEQLMSESVGQVTYDDEERLIACADYPETDETSTELHLIKVAKGLSPHEAEAKHIADIIENTVGKLQIKDKNGVRPAEYSDICILMRSPQNIAGEYVQVLSDRGIPVSQVKSDDLFERNEVKLLFAFLTAVDNPQKDIPLTSIMMSAVYGFTPDNMAKLRINSRSGKIYNSLTAYANEEKPDDELLQEKCIAFVQELYFYRKISSTMPSDSFLDIFFTRSGFLSIIGAELNGDVRIKNVRKILNLARDYEKNGFRGLSGFIRMIERLKETGGSLTSAQKKSDGEVKIMSVHGSKGLEFPVCILAAANESNRSHSETILYHPTLGVAFSSYDSKKLVKSTTEVRSLMMMEKQREETSEEMRILYVALTRAKEKLYLINSVTDGSTKPSSFESKISSLKSKLPIENMNFDDVSSHIELEPCAVESCNPFAEWFTLCALRHPSMSKLRSLAKCEYAEIIPTDTDMKFVYIDTSEEKESEEIEETEDTDIPEVVIDEKLKNMITRNLEFSYKYKELVTIPTKVSASALSHDEKSGFIVKSEPEFMHEGKIKGALRGTAFHEFLHYADMFSDNFNLKNELLRLKNCGFLSEEQINAIEEKAISQFMSSELFFRMKSAERVMREYRFAVTIPAALADASISDENSDVPIFMQGAIDCVFIENGKAVIVDYKTDKTKSMENLKEKYAKQLLLYKNAFEQSEEIQVSECIIYSLELNQSIKL